MYYLKMSITEIENMDIKELEWFEGRMNEEIKQENERWRKLLRGEKR